MDKPSSPKPLSALVGRCLADLFKRQGFASSELVIHWEEIVGAEIAACAEPIRMVWTRASDPDESPPATLVLRVEGPAAIEIQHQSAVIVERVNRYFGWQALAGIALRQAPLTRRRARKPPADRSTSGWPKPSRRNDRDRRRWAARRPRPARRGHQTTVKARICPPIASWVRDGYPVRGERAPLAGEAGVPPGP